MKLLETDESFIWHQKSKNGYYPFYYVPDGVVDVQSIVETVGGETETISHEVGVTFGDAMIYEM